LQFQEWSYQQELDELQSVVAARQQIEAAQEYIAHYLDGLAAGLEGLDIDLDTLTDEQIVLLAQEYFRVIHGNS
jgi:hypothetical protein